MPSRPDTSTVEDFEGPLSSEEQEALARAVGERIAEARGRLPRTKLAELVGIHPNTLTNYETGKRLSDVGTILLISKATGASVRWLLTGEGPRSASEPQGAAPPAGRDYSDPARFDDGLALIQHTSDTVARIAKEMGVKLGIGKASDILRLVTVYNMEEADVRRLISLIASAPSKSRRFIP